MLPLSAHRCEPQRTSSVPPGLRLCPLPLIPYRSCPAQPAPGARRACAILTLV
ncbi:hypothetical protein [Lysobacter gummosus]|uniref:hypothetical protein n=1 Tax=Lysobacter gummosus TaxID=262324 RepID=UPI00363955AF